MSDDNLTSDDVAVLLAELYALRGVGDRRLTPGGYSSLTEKVRRIGQAALDAERATGASEAPPV